MATGIMIMGSSGSGKTTLGELVAKELGYTFVDIDEYIWRKDTEIPFSTMYPKAEKSVGCRGQYQIVSIL